MDIFEGGSERVTQTDEDIMQLFRACDRGEKGFIVQEELEELCMSLGITAEDSRTLFSDLDADNDGKISFNDFSTGFSEFLNPEKPGNSPQGANNRRTSMWTISTELTQKPERCNGESPASEEQLLTEEEQEFAKRRYDRSRKESIYQAWTTFTSSLVESNLLSLSPESQSQIRQLYKELQCKVIPQTVANRVESTVKSLVKEMEHLHIQNKSLEQLYQKEKNSHMKALKCLEAEIEDQVARVEEKAKEKAEIEKEEEKRQLREQMDREFAEMKTHLQIFQKVESWLTKEHGSDEGRMTEAKKKLEDAWQTNRDLQKALHETTTNLALLRSDLAHSRLKYEEKCKELHTEREQVLEYMHQYDNLRRQLDLIHNANKRLQDTNDSLRESLETELRCSGSVSRSSSIRSSNKKMFRESQSTPVPLSPSAKETDNKNPFAIRRLLEDLDSGLSTLPDKYDEEPPSPQQDIRFRSPSCSSVEDPGRGSGDTETPPATATHRMSSPFVFNPLTPKDQASKPSISHMMRYEEPSLFASLKAPERTYKVVFAGDAAVGKTTFLTRLCQGIFLVNTATTLGVDYKVKALIVDGKHIVIQLWDTAGQERFRSITKSYFRRADGVVLLYDVTNERSFTNVRHWIESIDESCDNNKIPIVICGNKIDRRDESIAKGYTVVCRASGQRLAIQHNASFYETSAKTEENVLTAIEDLARQMVTSEDMAVRTSNLRINSTRKKKRCCFSSK